MEAPTQQSKARRIGIIANPQFAHGRNILRGAIRYIETYRPEIKLDVFGNAYPHTADKLCQYDGILSGNDTEDIQSPLTELNIDWVGLYPSHTKSMEFQIDNDAIGALAAKTLDECGVVSYGYYDSMHNHTKTNEHISRLRFNGFQNAIQQFARPQHAPKLQIYTASNSESLAEWIQQLPKPTGIFTYNDLGAISVIETCRNQEISIPDELRLISVDNDQLLCSLNQPKISSINPQMDLLSFEAMRRLVRRIEATDIEAELTSSKPTPIAVLRETTGHTSCAHPTVQKALHYIRVNGAHRLTPADLAATIGIGLRSLELAFREALNCTIQQKLLETELNSVKQLLRNTDDTIENISARIGWEPSSLQHAFKRSLGCAPGAYRAQFRPNAPKKKPKFQPNTQKSLRIGVISTLISQAHHEILRGLEAYCQEHPHIQIALRIVSKYDALTDKSTVLGGDESFAQYDGYIVTAEVDIPKELIQAKPMMTIDHHRNQKIGLAFHVDNYGAGQRAAQQFLQRAYTQFAYISYQADSILLADNSVDTRADNRYKGFYDSLLHANIPTANIQRAEFSSPERLSEWLATLPPKTAIYSFNDALSIELLNACKHIQRKVPEDIALLSTDNDSFLCNLSTPTISSIDIDFRRAGYESAHALTQIIQNPETTEMTNGTIRVRQLIERESSQALGSTDPDLNTAVRFIQAHYSEDLGIDTIVAATQLSRRSLENRFKQILQRSMLQELQATRIKAAQDLLTGTDLTIKEIAAKCGFKHARYFCKFFKENTEITPLDYRKAYSESR